MVTPAAYLLFYRRRSEHPLGGEKLEKILDVINTPPADSNSQPPSRDASPSGEGRRLGDSSHNGSSSAFAAGQTHRVGDGGPAITKTMKSRGLTGVPPEDGGPLKSVEMTSNEDDELPGYTPAGYDPSGVEQHFSRNMSDGFDHNDDSGVDTDGPTYGPPAPWHRNNWSFNTMGTQMAAAPPGSPDPDAGDEDIFQDSASTKVEGGDDSDVHESWPASDDEMDSHVHGLMNTSGGARRSTRESAPPPDSMDVDSAEQPVHIVPPVGDDEDEDLPVVELHAGDGA